MLGSARFDRWCVNTEVTPRGRPPLKFRCRGGFEPRSFRSLRPLHSLVRIRQTTITAARLLGVLPSVALLVTLRRREVGWGGFQGVSGKEPYLPSCFIRTVECRLVVRVECYLGVGEIRCSCFTEIVFPVVHSVVSSQHGVSSSGSGMVPDESVAVVIGRVGRTRQTGTGSTFVLIF